MAEQVCEMPFGHTRTARRRRRLQCYTSFKVAGRSTASRLGFEMAIESDGERHAVLGELLKRKILDDRSVNITVHVSQFVHETKILYIDARTVPPTRVLLTTAGHPLAPQDGST